MPLSHSLIRDWMPLGDDAAFWVKVQARESDCKKRQQVPERAGTQGYRCCEGGIWVKGQYDGSE